MAAYFKRYDVLLTPVRPIPAQKDGNSEFIINGQNVDATFIKVPWCPSTSPACDAWRSSSVEAAMACR